METTENVQELEKKEHHMAKKARLAREEKERIALQNSTQPPSPPPQVTANKRPRTIIRAFEKQDFHYVMVDIAKDNTIKNKRQSFFPPFFSHPGIDNIIHPETGNPCIIRHIPGESSIFKDDQSRDATDAKCAPIMFQDGYLLIKKAQKATKQFLDLCNANASNPNRIVERKAWFFHYEENKYVEAVYAADIALAKALVYFNEKCSTDDGINDLMAYAQTLGMNMSRSWSEIKADLSQFLKTNTKMFLDGLDSPNMKRKYIILEALKIGVIVKDANSGTISWAAGGTLCVPPIGKDPIDYMVEWSNDAGKNSYDYLKDATEKFLLEKV